MHRYSLNAVKFIAGLLLGGLIVTLALPPLLLILGVDGLYHRLRAEIGS